MKTWKRNLKNEVKTGLFAALAAMLSFGVTGAPVRAEEENGYVLPLFETSDVHGYLADTSTDRYEYRLAYISDKVRDERSRDGVYRKERAVLLDGGDIFQGNTVSNFLKGHSISAAYQLMDYDAVTIGNHEFDWDIGTVIDPDGTLLDSALDEEVLVNDVPVVASNIYQNRKLIEFAKEYVILEKEAVNAAGETLPVKVGVIGFTEDHSSSIMFTLFTGAGFLVLADYNRANELARELEESGQCDLTILLAHAAAADTAYALGEGSVIDLVLGGHTHTNVSGTTVYGIPYMQPAANGTAYCRTELRFRKEDGRAVFGSVGRLETVTTTDNASKMTPVEANASELDPAVRKLTDRIIGEISDLLETKIGIITVAAMKSGTIPGSGGRATTGGNWMASIIQRSAEAEIGFVNGGGIRTSFPLQNERRIISASDVFTMFPFSNRIFRYELTYSELLTLLRYALSSAGETLLSRMVGIECYFSGREVQALVKDGKCIYLNGEWKNGWADKKVTVGVSEFVATTDRKSDGLSNPLTEWSKTGRLVSDEVIDVEGAIRVLDEEAAANNWHLEVDTKAWFIDREYRDPDWTKEDDEASDPSASPETLNPEEGTGPAIDRGPAEAAPSILPWLLPVVIGVVLLLGLAAVLFLLRRRKKAD